MVAFDALTLFTGGMAAAQNLPPVISVDSSYSVDICDLKYLINSVNDYDPAPVLCPRCRQILLPPGDPRAD